MFEETVPGFESLEYLNLRFKRKKFLFLLIFQKRENKFDKLEEFSKLNTIEKLKVLIFSFNPVIQKNTAVYVYETLNVLPKLERINKIKVINKTLIILFQNFENKITKNIREKSLGYAQNKWEKEQEVALLTNYNF